MHLTFMLAAALTLQQDPCLAPGLAAMAAATTREDSVALAERLLEDPPNGERACGEMLAGYLMGMTSSPAEDAWRHRERGTALLEAAARSFTDEPRLYLAMSILLHHRQSRGDGLRTLDRALGRADRSAVPLTARERALIWYQKGLMHQDQWRDGRSFGDLRSTAQGQWHCGLFEENVRDNVTGSSSDHEWLVAVNYVCPEQFDHNMAEFFVPRRSMRESELAALEHAFRQALEADPAFLPAAEALLGEYVYLAAWEKADALTAELLDRFPEDWRSYLYRGLVLHETGRDSLAAPTFARAFLYMPEDEARRIENFAVLLTPEQQEWLAQVDTAVQRRAANAYWASLDPLYLTRENERKIEHYARVVAAELMFSAATLRERGADTYAGRLWIRYGRPLNMRELNSPRGRVVFWDYGPGPDITFVRGAGYQSYRWTDQGRQYTEALQASNPQAYDARAVFDTVEQLPYQVVRTLDRQARPQLLLYAGVPEAFAPDAEVGFTLMDQQFQPAAQWRGGRPEGPGLRAELNEIGTGTYWVTVEVWDRAARHVGRVRDTVTTLTVEDSAFTVSDLLLARRIEPAPGVDDPASRRDLRIDPLFGATVRRGATVGLYWEMYRFSEPEGRLRCEVSLEVRDAGGRSVLTRVLRGVGIGGEREPETRIRYESARPLFNGRAVEWLELGALPAGEYRLVLRLKDRESGREVTRERKLVVS